MLKAIQLKLEIIKKEKVKFERAMQRLEDLYLFDDEAMSEKDYMIKKKKINEKLQEIKIINLKALILVVMYQS